MDALVLVYICYAVLQSILVVRFIIKPSEGDMPLLMFALFTILAPVVSLVTFLSGLELLLKRLLMPSK